MSRIEVAAGQRYREYGLDRVADDPPPPVEVLAQYSRSGRAWVVDGEEGNPVGYLLVAQVDEAAHIEQVSVDPGQQGRGWGRALVERATAWAAERQLAALTLTTFEHLPWNRPLYEHLGFRVLGEDELGPALRRLRDAETARGLDPALRVVMRRDVISGLGALPRTVDHERPAATPTARTSGREARVLVRPATRHDVAPAAEVYLRSRHASVPAIPPPVHTDDETRAWFAEVVSAQRELWIAERGGGLLGVMVLDGDVVDQLYVDPDHTGQGVGAHLLAVARSLRPGGLQLWTFRSNAGARRFYERHGFTAVQWTDGSTNEEGAPDVRYRWRPG